MAGFIDYLRSLMGWWSGSSSPPVEYEFIGTVNLRETYITDKIRIASMLNFLPVNNQFNVEVNGYRNNNSKELITNATLIVVVYTENGASLIAGTLTPDGEGNYATTLSGSSLEVNQRYRVTITDVDKTVWTKWFYAHLRAA